MSEDEAKTTRRPKKRPNAEAPATPETPAATRRKTSTKAGVRPAPSAQIKAELLDTPPADADALHAFLREAVGITVARSPLVEGNAAPFDYLLHVFFEGRVPGRDNHAHSPDCLVWANRGGGKTFLGAVATMLDMVFKPGVQIRLLGGSLEQSQRMYDHLRTLFDSPLLAELVKGRPTIRRIGLVNGSAAQVLAASQTAVRGTRVQKIRCDEVDLFDHEMWEAAQLTTRSLRINGPWGKVVHGSIEALSTMHRPFGLMQRLVEDAHMRLPARPVFKWGVLDVIEHCTDEHACEGCVLRPECAGRAKAESRADAGGHIRVADATAMKMRVGEHVWASEMLCSTPRRSDCVYPEFNRTRHVVDEAPLSDRSALVAGMDFGFRSESALVLGRLDGDGRLTILREHVRPEITVSELAGVLHAWLAEMPGGDGMPAKLAFIGVDPAGRQRSDQTGKSAVDVLKGTGLTVRTRGSTILEGVNLVRSRLAPAATPVPRLLVHASCTRLIECLVKYHYPADDPRSVEPVKDGSDHACDALRYLVLNLDAGAKVEVSQYT